MSPTEPAPKPSFIRINVYIRKTDETDYEKANFSTCLFDYFGIDEYKGLISCHIEDNKVFMQPVPKLSVSNLQTQKKATKNWQTIYKIEVLLDIKIIHILMKL